MKLNDLQKDLDKLQFQIKAVLSKVDNEMDNVQYNRDDLEESYIFSEYYTIIDKLQQIDNKLKYLGKSIKANGRLMQNARGRYELPNGYEFSSGLHCEILVTSTFGYDYWVYTTIEHNGEFYYATSLGRDVRIDGYFARIR